MSRSLPRLAALVLLAAALWVAWPSLGPARLAAEPRPVAPRGDLGPSERATIELFKAISPSVVHVLVAERGRMGSGTGFVWDGDGHVVTNAHVVGDAREVRVRLGSGETFEAEVVGRAPNSDLAVLRLRGARTLPPPLPVGASADLLVGQSVLAVGNPFGLDQTLTTGVISALKRRLPTEGGREIADVIQTDAAINPGNSGGPLVDSAGRLIGVNTAIYSPSGASAGIGFAIPVDTVNRVVPLLIRDGRVPTPAIGVSLAPEGAAARAGIEGLVIIEPLPGSPAAKAGLRGIDPRTGAVGDVIVSADGTPVRALADLADVLERKGVGGTVELGLVRDGGRTTVTVGIMDAEG